jgi:hypothetical protein
LEALVVHHSGTGLHTSVESIRRYHLAPPPKGRGFPDIGYHYLIGNLGEIHPGRPPDEVGFHAAGHNQRSLGLCVIGDNTRPEHSWSFAQLDRLAEFVRYFRLFYPQARVLGHRDLPGAATLCPGLDVRELLAKLGLPLGDA